MKKSHLLPLLLCLLLCLSACGEASPAPAPAPAESAAEEAPSGELAPTPTPSVPEELTVCYSLPAADDAAAGLLACFSGAEELDCSFLYPDDCEQWVEDGVIRLSPRRYFARVFLSSVRRDSEDAPDSLLGLLDTAKWNSTANETTVGGRYDALRMSNWKYDTYRRWIVWATETRYYTLYASCFDRYADNANAILDTIAASFTGGEDLVSASAERGELLRQRDGLSLFFEGASLAPNEGGYALRVELRAANAASLPATLAAGENACTVDPGESALWPLRLPLPAQSPCRLEARLGDELLEDFGPDLLIKES